MSEPEGSLAPRQATSGPLATPEPVHAYAIVPEREAHFWDYWRVIVRHRWTVISFFLALVIAGTVWTVTTRPVYRGTATLKIEKEEPRVLKFEDVVKADPQPDYYQTLYKVIESRTLATRVVGLLRLDQHPEFARAESEQGWAATAKAWAREKLVTWIPLPAPAPPESEPGVRLVAFAGNRESETEDLLLESPLTRAFAGRLSVEPVRNARLVKVSFESHYPDLAARVPNALAEAFIASQLDQKIEATRGATQFLAKQIDEARDKLEVYEGKLNDFLKEHDILFVTADKVGDRQDLTIQQLTSVSEALLRARAERIAKESLVAQAARQGSESVPAVLQSPVIVKLKEDLATMEGEYRKLGQTFKPEYPRMQRLSEAIAEARAQLRAETARVVESLDADYRSAVRTEQELQKVMDDQRNLARRLGDQMAQYNLLRRDVDTSRELYVALLTRLKETQISAALLTSNTSIVDRSEVPLAPVKPRSTQNLLIASLIGLLGGVGLAFFREYLDTSIRDAREVENVLRVPSLGLVPSREALEGRRARRRRELAGETTDGSFAVVAHADMGSVLAEAFRNLRTSLLYSAPDRPPRTLIVTSLQPEDGKTSIACNLAITLAQLGAGEVLLIDGDMRRPNLHEILGVEQAPGLSTLLTGQAELGHIVRDTRIPNLLVIPSGRVPLNPAELMASRRLGQALEALGGRFAHIVVDTPPLFGVSDAAILAPRVDGVVLVLRHGRASRDGAQRAIQLLGSMHARLLGVVLNDVLLRGAGYYGYYGYHGSYGPYGYGESRRADA